VKIFLLWLCYRLGNELLVGLPSRK
jgi:hypothetical protein